MENIEKSALKVENKDLFKNRNDNFERMTVTAPYQNHTIAVDLTFFSHNYVHGQPLSKAVIVMNAVDVFSRKVASIKIKNKSTGELKRGLSYIMNQFGGIPKRIWSDEEAGLNSNDMLNTFKKQGIEFVITRNGYNGSNSVSIVESFNKAFRWYYNNKTSGTVDKRVNETIDIYVKNKNNKPHSTTGFIPNEIMDGKNLKLAQIEQAMRAAENKKEPSKKFHVGDLVHLQTKKKTIQRKDAPNFEKAISTIIAVLDTTPTTYLLDTKGKTRYYGYQLKHYVFHPNLHVKNIENDDTDIESSEEEKEEKSETIANRIKLRRTKQK